MSSFCITPSASPERHRTESPERQRTPPFSSRTPNAKDQRVLDLFQQTLTPPREQPSRDSTPPRGDYDHIRLCPETPMRKGGRKRSAPCGIPAAHLAKRVATTPFRADPLHLVTAETPFLFSIPQCVDFKGYYTITPKHQELCIKQPPQKQSCGPGATLMLLSHYISLHPTIKLEESFWKFYMHSVCINQSVIMSTLETKTEIKSLGYQVKGAYYQREERINDKTLEKDPKIDYVTINDFSEDLLKKIHIIQAQTESPIIVSITNYLIEGHWIVIDRVAEDGVYIRDPDSGQAYKLTLEELYENWGDELPVKIIYLERRLIT